jgi:catechol 2,3-dioxygenase-like lactoylglutathione lyase family enzyme
MLLKLNHIQHIGIPVTDIRVSEAFYEELGFKNTMQSTFVHQGGEGKVIMMQLNSMVLELYQLPAPALQQVKQRGNGHIDHIAFDVDDIDVTYTQLKTAAFNVQEEAPVFLPFWKNGCKYFNITGPDGERLEFNQIL